MERFIGHIFGGENTHMCGSYMFSGHTIVIMIACLTINECKKRQHDGFFRLFQQKSDCEIGRNNIKY